MNCHLSTTPYAGYMEESLLDRDWIVRLFVIDYTKSSQMEEGISKLSSWFVDDPYEERFSVLKLPNALIREYGYDAFSQEFEFVYPGIADFYYLRFQYWRDSTHSRWSRAERMPKGGTVWNYALHHGYWNPGMLLDMSWREIAEVPNDTTRSDAEQRQFV